MQCAGGNAAQVWSGVRLRDVLRAAGLDGEADTEVQHIQVRGLRGWGGGGVCGGLQTCGSS